MRALAMLLALAACAAPPPARPADGIPAGPAQLMATIGGQPLTLFTDRVAGCTPTGLLLVFHGVDRNAAAYRDAAAPLARQACLLVVAPLFDEPRFPGWSYQRGGVVEDGRLRPAAEWTTALVPQVAAWARAQAGLPNLPYALLGHSAGGQFLSRVAAYQPGEATRFVIANPSTWVRTSQDVPAPYGFGPPWPAAEAEATLRRYLALPIAVLVGQNDLGTRNLSTNEEAEEQGATRYARGRNVFAEAEATARAHGWPFGWTLSVVPGSGHNAARMFGSAAAQAALAPAAK